MIAAIREFFKKHAASDDGAPSPPQSDEEALQLATAVLLVHVMRADNQVDQDERSEVIRGVREAFGLTDDGALALIIAAESQADAAISLHPLTTLLNNELDLAQRTHIIELMWRVVYADGHKDDEEEYLVR